MAARYRVHLTGRQREQLRRRVAARRGPARELTHARNLVQVDASPGGPAWPAEASGRALAVGAATFWRVRKRFVAQGLAGAVRRLARDRVCAGKLDGEQEAELIARSGSEPPAGHAHWSRRLLADQLVELRIGAAVSDETVRRALKQTRSSRG